MKLSFLSISTVLSFVISLNLLVFPQGCLSQACVEVNASVDGNNNENGNDNANANANMSTRLCDTHERCSVWKEEGECIREKAYMSEHCAASCASITTTLAVTNCEDAHARCPLWAELGECDSNRDMQRYCAKSCGTCDKSTVDAQGRRCRDQHPNCKQWANVGECDINPPYMHKNCAFSCGICKNDTADSKIVFNESSSSSSKIKKDNTEKNDRQMEWEDDDSLLAASSRMGVAQEASGAEKLRTLEIIRQSMSYIETEDVQSLPPKFRTACKNVHSLCSFWAAIGECEANKAYMKLNCAPACRSCHLIDISKRCPPLPKDTEPALRPGALNEMFERITATAPGNLTADGSTSGIPLSLKDMPPYTVQVLSRPSDEPISTVDLDIDKSLPPWIISFDNFLTSEECDEMIQIGHDEGYKRSEDVGKVKFDGTVDSVQSKGRTSENAWCSLRHGCRQKDLPKKLHERISSILDIPPENSEDFQILRYEIGQFYNQHHDYIPNQKDRQCGPRILTFFIYLSDVEEGGGTDFPKLGITVMPKKGSAVLWPSVYNAEPSQSDPRMDHQALPVEKGKKFAANGWIHMYDYIGPQERGCN